MFDNNVATEVVLSSVSVHSMQIAIFFNHFFPFVRPSRCDIVSKRMYISSNFLDTW